MSQKKITLRSTCPIKLFWLINLATLRYKNFLKNKKNNFIILSISNFTMPISRKKLAAKERIKHQFRDISSGQFVMQYSDSEEEFNYESTSSNDSNYLTDSSANEDYFI
jgi:hypothetical protein